MSNYFDLRHAVRDGSPKDLFALGDWLVNRFAQMNMTTEKMQTMSGADIAREISNWAEEDQQ